MRTAPIVAAAAVLAATLATPAAGSDASLERTLRSGVAQIRRPQTERRLDRELAAAMVSLRADRASTAAGRRGRALAIEGFAWTRKGIRAQLDMQANDSGNVEAATRDAKRADRCLVRGAAVLRAAGRAFGLRIGPLNGR
jgi:hypothetical protein